MKLMRCIKKENKNKLLERVWHQHIPHLQQPVVQAEPGLITPGFRSLAEKRKYLSGRHAKLGKYLLC